MKREYIIKKVFWYYKSIIQACTKFMHTFLIYWFYTCQVPIMIISEILSLLATYRIHLMQCTRTSLRNITFWGGQNVWILPCKEIFRWRSKRSTYIFWKCRASYANCLRARRIRMQNISENIYGTSTHTSPLLALVCLLISVWQTQRDLVFVSLRHMGSFTINWIHSSQVVKGHDICSCTFMILMIIVLPIV
jgi:hypothetical protein